MPKKNQKNKIDRMLFVQMCVENPKEGAKYLHDLADNIGKCKNVSEAIDEIQKALFVSKFTIYRDLEMY